MSGVLVKPWAPVSLVGVAQTEATRLLFEAASLTDDPNVLTMEDALGRTLLRMVSSDLYEGSEVFEHYHIDTRKYDQAAKEIKEALKHVGLTVEDVIRQRGYVERTPEIQKQARRFMKDASELVAVLKIKAVNLVGVPQNSSTREYFTAAGLTGDPNVLTVEDALGAAFLHAMSMELFRYTEAENEHSEYAVPRASNWDEVLKKREEKEEALKASGLTVKDFIRQQGYAERMPEFQERAMRFMGEASGTIATLKEGEEQ